MSDKRRIDQVIEGLQLLAAHEQCYVQAEHDVIYAGPPPGTMLPPSIVSQLLALGWHYEDDTESWATFT